MTEIIVRTIAVIMLMVYVYMPFVCLYGMVKLLARGCTEDLMCNPFFGIKKVSPKTGSIVWAMQFLYLGFILSEFYFYFAHDTHPFFLDYLTL